jgi:hypothetical protein
MALSSSQEQWLRVRGHLLEHRYDLAVKAAEEYPQIPKVEDTPLLTSPVWTVDGPIPLADIKLDLVPEATFTGATGSEDFTTSVRPILADGTRYPNYASAMHDLASPRVFENRGTYRLVEADLASSERRMSFGRGTYFDSINVGEACAHEYAAATLDPSTTQALRAAISDPRSPQLRGVNVAISTLTLRYDRAVDEATFYLHWRDPAKVGHAGGLYQVIPTGVFQAAGEAQWNELNDFDLWRCMTREFAEELLGESEDYNAEEAPIDYGAWPFAARITNALATGEVRAFYLGMGVDPLTFATDMLTVVVIDAPLFDDLFGGLVDHNEEGQVVGDGSRGIVLTADSVEQFARKERMQAAGAALLALAWRHRETLLA